MFGKNRRSVVALPSLALLAACVTERTALAPTPIALTPVEVQDTTAKSNSTDDLEFPDAPTPDAPTPDESTQSLALSEPPAQKSPKEFALELVKMMGTSPAKCGAAANNTPQVNWTCAPYTGGLGTFITNWDQLIKSAEFSLTHSYTATSDWMYFAIDGEIDFFYKTYDLETTQVLVAYDPSEKGNELIIGLNPNIGNQIAAANGSHRFISAAPSVSTQE